MTSARRLGRTLTLLAAVGLLAACATGRSQTATAPDAPEAVADASAPSTQPDAAATTAPEAATTNPDPPWPRRAADKPIARPASPQHVFILPIDGEINDMTLWVLERMAGDARDAGADLLILRIDTWGGAVTSALDISTFIKNGLADIWTVAYVDPKAISAGALIALAADEIVMIRNGRFGDCAPIAPGGKLEGIEREKIESPLRQEFRDSAQHNGYDPLLAQAMVTAGIAVYEAADERTGEHRFVDQDELDKLTQPTPSPWVEVGQEIADSALKIKLRHRVTGETLLVPTGEAEKMKADQPADWKEVRVLVKSGELLSMTYREAERYGFTRAILDNDRDLAGFYGFAPGSATEMHLRWSEGLAALLASMAVQYILLVVLMLGVYLELNTPGVGLPGLIALIALVLLIGGPWIAGLAQWWEVTLIFVGLGLIALEVFVIPGFGVTGILGICCFFAGLVLIFLPQNFEPGSWQPWPAVPETWDYLKRAILTIFLGLASFVVLAVILSRYLRRMPVVGRLVLADGGEDRLATRLPPTDASGRPDRGGRPTARDAGAKERAGLKIGQEGVVVAKCRPAGKARFGGRVVDAVAEGEFIEAGRKVRIVRFAVADVVVEPVRNA